MLNQKVTHILRNNFGQYLKDILKITLKFQCRSFMHCIEIISELKWPPFNCGAWFSCHRVVSHFFALITPHGASTGVCLLAKENTDLKTLSFYQYLY